MANIRVKFLIIVCLGIASCRGYQRPADVMTKEEFSSYLVEIYLAEGRLAMSPSIPKDSAMKLFKPFEEKLIREKGLSDSAIHKTYQYYLEHPDLLEEVYDVVIDTLSLREQRAQSKLPK